MNNRPFMIGLLLTGILLITQQVQAANQPINAFENGFYLGGALGADWGHSTWAGVSKIGAVNDNSTPLNVFESWIPKGRSMETEFVGRAMLGYQLLHDCIYLATELGGTFSNGHRFDLHDIKNFEDSFIIDSLVVITSINANATLYDEVTLGRAEFNLDLKPGWLVQENFLVYGRAGLAVNELTIRNAGTWTNNSLFFGTPTTLIIQDSSENSKTSFGIRLGFGAEYLFTQHLGFTLDYIYTNYGNISTIAEASASGDGSGETNQVNIEGLDAPNVGVSTQALMVGLVYHC